MSESTTARPRGKSPVPLILTLLVAVGALVAGAMFQEQIGFFFSMQGWDPGRPGKTVVSFLEAGRKGDKNAAAALLKARELLPMEKDGKWIGYSTATPAGTLEFVMTELAPEGAIQPKKTELVYSGSGSALVTVADRAGEDVVYRLVVADGEWKINEIRGGRVKK